MIVTTKATTIAAERQGTEQAAATRAERETHRPWHRVLVCLAGAVFEDAVPGFDREDAMLEAEANWCTHTRYIPATWILYCGLDDEQDAPP